MEFEMDPRDWYHWVCSIFGLVVHKQCLWNAMVHVAWCSNLWYFGSYIIPVVFDIARTNKTKAAALWVSEAAIGVGYPEENRKGLYSESSSARGTISSF